MPEESENNDKTQTHLVLTENTEVGHYQIVKKIGAGGMGEVYLADDTELDRKVALKFLPPHLCQDEDCRKRFKREAQAAARLDHPNIIPVYEVHEFQGRPYFAMAAIEGQSLKDQISGKDVPIEKILNWGIQICEGLQAAHDKGIIHRDIKPSNILIDSHGRARIVDFGLAAVADTDQLTKTGSTLGTIGYMSPEQVQGKEIDHRSDLFSLGVVLYELITNKNPFKKDSEAATLKAVCDDTPEPLSRYKNDVPDELQQIITKLMEKNPEYRYQTSKGVLSDLKRISVKSDAVAGMRKPSIVVLPFTNLSADPEQEYFCDGMAEEIINALTRIENLRVIARTSAFSFKNKALDVREIGKKLDVETLLEGSVRKSGNRLRIMAQLVTAKDGSHLWSQRFDKNMDDVFEVQDEISLAIVEKLKVKLIGDERDNIAKNRVHDIDAYNLYLQGRFHWNKRTTEHLKKAVDCFERAINIDSAFALAYTGLADCYSMLQQSADLSPTEAFPKAKEYAKKALEIDDLLAEAHTSLAHVIESFDWDWAGAEKDYKRALELNPGYATGHQWYAMFLREMNRLIQAVEEIQKAEELDPLSLIIKVASAWVYLGAGKPDVARKQCLKVLEMDSNFFFAHFALSEIYSCQGLKDKAVEELLEGGLRYRYTESEIAILRRTFRENGWRGFWRGLLDLQIKPSKGKYIFPFYIALIYARLEETDKVFDWLDKAYAERDPSLVHLLIESGFSSIRSDSRFQALLKKMKLSD
jgi:serine/threonine-protein kinase